MHEAFTKNRSHYPMSHRHYTVRAQGLDHKQLMDNLANVCFKEKAYESSQLMKRYVIQFWLNNNLFGGKLLLIRVSVVLHYITWCVKKRPVEMNSFQLLRYTSHKQLSSKLQNSKNLEFQLVLWTNSFHILTAQSHRLLDSLGIRQVSLKSCLPS